MYKVTRKIILDITIGYYMMVIFRLLVSEFKTQTSTPPNPCGISCIVQLHAQGPGTTMEGYI